MLRRPASHRLAAVLAAALLATACTTPAVGDDDPAVARERILDLLDDVASAFPPSVDYATPTRTGDVTCSKKFLGFTVADTGTRRVEAPAVVPLPKEVDGITILDTIESRWRESGYDIDTSDRNDNRFPKIRGRVDGYLVVATAWTDRPQITLYAVSPCLRRR